MSYDPFHLGEAGRARLAALIAESHGQSFEYPGDDRRNWLSRVWRRIRVARHADTLNEEHVAPVSAHTLSIYIEIKY